jgi:hypothetical protein
VLNGIIEVGSGPFIGRCNQCGSCCRGSRGTVCEHLEIAGLIGQARATSCRAYADRTDGMPIRMLTRAGVFSHESKCWKDSPFEAVAIASKGFGQGCSLKPRRA